MASIEPTLTELAERGERSALEDRWFDAIEAGDDARSDLLAALAALTKRGMGDHAATLAWTWLTTEQDRAESEDLLALGRELLLRCGDSDEMRREVFRLYEEVFADRPEIHHLLEASGLSGGKSAMRALRTLEICLRLEVGDHLVSRSEEQAAEVTAIEPASCTYTVRAAHGEETLDPDALALAYDPADANDFRVLVQLQPERIGEMLDADPVALVVGILKGHHGPLDSDQLEHVLSPRFIPTKAWRKWWTAAKRGLKRCPNVVIEGKTRVIMTYHAEGRSLEEEILPQWAAAENAAQRLAVIETYLREAKSRKTSPKSVLVRRMHRDLLSRVKVVRQGAPGEALVEALLIDRLATVAKLDDEAVTPARDVISETQDLVTLLREMSQPRLYPLAIAHVKESDPDEWPAVYARLLPTAPLEGCDVIADTLIKAGHRDLLVEAAERIPTDFDHHLDALCWLWRGPNVDGLQPIPPRELLLRLLEHLGRVMRSELASADTRRNARQKIRSALSHAKYTRYKQVIADMEAGLASTVRRTIDRLDGLGQVVRADLLRIIIETHPELIIAPTKIDPWTDDGILFCTQQGMARREEEVNYLNNVKIPENAKAIGEAAARGDLSENSEYKSALEERDLLQARLIGMQNELALARLITAADVSTDRVDIGTRVTLQAVDGPSRHELTILGPLDADIDKKIYNYQAPLCMKLKELQVGDTVTLPLDGDERDYRIEDIANALES